MATPGFVDFGGVRYKLIDNGDSTVSLAVADPAGWRVARKTVTFTGAAGLGAVGTVNLFTVTGDIMTDAFVGKCTTSLTEAGATATIQVGTATTTNHFLTVQNAVDIDINELWGSTVSRATTAQPNTTTTYEYGAINQDIIATIGAQAVNGGVITFTVFWRPISVGATLVAA